jgi:hypothetical protein
MAMFKFNTDFLAKVKPHLPAITKNEHNLITSIRNYTEKLDKPKYVELIEEYKRGKLAVDRGTKTRD